MVTNLRNILLITGCCAVFFSCTSSPAPESLEGTYRATLESPGGELAFPLHIEAIGDSLSAFVVNGADTARFDTITVQEDSLILGFVYYDAFLRTKVHRNGSLTGKWDRRSSAGSRSVLPLKAKQNIRYRYPETSPGTYPFDGEWQATFTDESGTFPAHGIFVTEPGGKLHGTFRTETGDYRFLEGTYTDSTFIMSTFDGAHAFLFKGNLRPDGSLSGDFWSRDTYHATWTAQKGEAKLRDPLQISANEAVGKKLTFSFPDPEGNTVTSSDDKFQGKPLLVYLFGSWCPNCSDEARMLRNLYEERYKETDLQIAGLAYEFTGNFEQDAAMVNKYKQRFDIPWHLLVAGTSNKRDAAQTLPFLESVISYPTSIFADRSHTIKAIHVGFNGPATGSAYYQEIQRFNEHINEIIHP